MPLGLTFWRTLRGRLGIAVILTGCLSSEIPPTENPRTENAPSDAAAQDEDVFSQGDSLHGDQPDSIRIDDDVFANPDSGSGGDTVASSDPGTAEEPAPSVDSGQPVSDIAANYAAYQKITDKVIQVNPELAMLCVGASQAHVEAARETYGPHAHTGILIYMNDKAASAFAEGGTSYPVGSVVVKHKTMNRYRKDGQWVKEADNGVGGMVKRAPGFDPGHGDWEYFYFEDSGPIESGRIASCVQCHAAAKDQDHVFGTWKGP